MSIKPALRPEEWAEYGGKPCTIIVESGRVVELAPPERHAVAALNLHEQPFGFSHEMLNGVYTLLWFSGTGFCPRCTEQTFEGGTGKKGDADCVVRCVACGWQPVSRGTERELGAQVAQRLQALLPPVGTGDG